MFLYDGGTLRILHANDVALTQYGYSQSELRSMTIRDLRPHGDAPSLGTALLLDSETPSKSIWTHASKAGKNFPVEVKIVPFKRGHRNLWLMSAVDASAWSNARLKLVHSEEMHRSLVEKSPFGIYRLDLTTDRFEQVNPVLLEMLGFTRGELFTCVIRDLYIDPNDRDRFLSSLRSAGIAQNFETRLRRKDGSIIRTSISGYLCAHVDTGDQYVQGYVLDITRQREL
jgi:PAS domain S-box-containing protein